MVGMLLHLGVYIVAFLLVCAMYCILWLWYSIKSQRLAEKRAEYKLYEETKRWD